MIFGNTISRLEYPTCKAIETSNFLIINGETYDKKTLAKLNSKQLELGFLNVTNYNKLLGLSSVFDGTASTWTHASYNADVGSCFEYNVAKNFMSVVDSKDGNIEWSIIGETVIKFNIEKKTFELYRSIGYAYTCTMFLYQDDDYIYFAGKIAGTPSAIYLNTIKKSNGEYKNITTAASGSYYVQFDVLRRQDDKVYAVSTDLTTKYHVVISCGGGNITSTPITYTEPNSLGGYTGTYMSSLDKETNGGYIVLANSTIKYKIVDNSAITGDDHSDSFISPKKIKGMAELLKTKYPEETKELEDTAIITKYMTLLYTGATTVNGNGYRQIKCSIAGTNNQFLVISSAPGGGRTNRNDDIEKSCFIAVFKRNNPTEDPMDLTMVDYYRYYDIRPIYGGQGNIFKINNSKYVQNGDFGVRLINLSEEGKLSFKIYYNQDVHCFGLDSLGRLYVVRKANTQVEMFNDQLPYDITLEYEKEGDEFTPYQSDPIVKNVIVKIKNCYGEPIVGNFELGLSGKAQFSKTSSTTYRGATSVTGSETVGLKITAPTKVCVSKRIIYNNELSYSKG